MPMTNVEREQKAEKKPTAKLAQSSTGFGKGAERDRADCPGLTGPDWAWPGQRGELPKQLIYCTLFAKN